MPAGASVTNTQTQGVDEGDIVKQLGRFLIVLQDGRLFVVDTAPGGQPGLALTSRANVYRSASNQMWYDEMLVSGNRILVTGYSYRESASEITVFTLNDAGRLHREAIYYLSSNDYYSAENYATRLVNGNLVVYTPLNIAYLDPDQPLRWPLIRRWVRDGERQAETTRGKPLFDAHDIYKPIRPTLAPFVHSVSVCPLGDLRSGDELDCRTTAFVGTSEREFFVSTSDIYLWVTPGWGDRECQDDARGRAGCGDALPSAAVGARSRARMFTRGAPINQFALDANGGEFRALLGWDGGCGGSGENPRVRYFHAPLGAAQRHAARSAALGLCQRTEPRWIAVRTALHRELSCLRFATKLELISPARANRDRTHRRRTVSRDQTAPSPSRRRMACCASNAPAPATSLSPAIATTRASASRCSICARARASPTRICSRAGLNRKTARTPSTA